MPKRNGDRRVLQAFAEQYVLCEALLRKCPEEDQ
jgi:hypothetical protein